MTTLPAGWKPIESAPKDGTEILLYRGPGVYNDAPVAARVTSGSWVEWEQTAAEYHATTGEYLGRSLQDAGAYWGSWDGGFTEDMPPTHWMPLPAAPGTPPASAQPARDWELDCDHCNGSGHVFVTHQVAERTTDVQEFKEECECCEGRGFVFAFQDIPGIEEYVKSCRSGTQGAPITVSLDPDPRGVSVGVWQGSRCIYNGAHAVPSAQDDAKDEQARFEAWSEHTNQGYDLTRNVSGRMATYESNTTEHAYRGFFHGMNAPAAGDARDAARWRSFRNAITQQDIGWLDRMDTALTAMGCDLDDETPPSADQVDAAADAAIAAQQGKGSEHA